MHQDREAIWYTPNTLNNHAFHTLTCIFHKNFHFDGVMRTTGRSGLINRVTLSLSHPNVVLSSSNKHLSSNSCNKHLFCKFHHLNLYLPSIFPQALSTLSNEELSDHPGKGIDGDRSGQISPLFPASAL